MSARDHTRPPSAREQATSGDERRAIGLLELTAQLSATLSVADVTRLVATDAVDALDASSAFVAIAVDDGSALQMHAHARTEGAGPATLCRLEATAPLPVIDAWKHGGAVYVPDHAELCVRYPALDAERPERAAVAALPLDVDGDRLGAVCITWPEPQAFDAIQQVQLVALASLCAQALRRARLAADLERMRHEFSVTASHELRTPLTAILGAASTLVEPFDLSDESRAELARLVVVEAERMRAVLDDLRVTADLDSGRGIDVRVEPVDVNVMLRDVVGAWMRLPVELPTMCIVVDEDSAQRPRVLADPRRLRQVLAHLVDNACKYGPRDGTVRLRAVVLDEERIRIEVLDEGPGIAPRLRTRAFERFWRGDPVNRSGVSGTGLGLYVSRMLVNAMGGTIALEPVDDGARGTCASVVLPAVAG
jgi:signal transduction histidine kinase